MKHLTTAEIEEGLAEVLAAPKSEGVLRMIVRRPREDAREVLETGTLDVAEGLVGDVWKTDDGDPETQITLMNARLVALIAGGEDRWPLAGDQLYVDLDLSEENLPVGTRLAVGDALLEVTAKPHNGCKKFVERYGLDAMRFVNSPVGRQNHLRGIYAKVVAAGPIRAGDTVKKL